VCASCKAANEPGELFCGECGEQLAEPAKPRTPPNPLSCTPKHLAEKILTSRSALEGERKQVTVLFADVQGSMALAAASVVANFSIPVADNDLWGSRSTFRAPSNRSRETCGGI
jgi:hypothetical protein